MRSRRNDRRFVRIGTALILIELVAIGGVRAMQTPAQAMAVETGRVVREIPCTPETDPVLTSEPYEPETTAFYVDPENFYGDPEPEEEYLGNFILTAYCGCSKCCGKNAKKGADGEWLAITRSGVRAQKNHTIAVDPKVIPLGTRVRIGDVIYTAEDTGGKWVQGKHIDIYLGDHQAAAEFGCQHGDVWMIKD